MNQRNEGRLLGLVFLLGSIFVFQFFQIGCTSKNFVKPECKDSYGQDIQYIHWYPVRDKTFRIGHLEVAEDLAQRLEGTGPFTVEKGERIGKIIKRPSLLSQKHGDSIRRARDLYSKNRFREAAEILYPALRDEPENLFIMDELARTLFWIQEERSESFNLYKRLISSLDASFKEEREIVLVDMWFCEAYWKLGCLHLDRKEYEKAIFEITRGMTGMLIENPEQPGYEQALSYLCEAYHFLGNHTFAKYFACKTLEINPNNTYVLGFVPQVR